MWRREPSHPGLATLPEVYPVDALVSEPCRNRNRGYCALRTNGRASSQLLILGPTDPYPVDIYSLTTAA